MLCWMIGGVDMYMVGDIGKFIDFSILDFVIDIEIGIVV